MSKVIHKPNIKSSHLSFNSLLHRGQKSKDPYNKRLNFNPARLLLKTLGTSGILNPRCSSTFNSDSKFNNYINNSKNLRIAGISSLLVLLTLSTLFIYPVVKNLNTAEAVTPKNSTTTLNITTGASANVKLLVQNSSGTFAKSDSSDRASFSVTTDNYAGYNLIIKGKDSNYNKLTNSSTNTSLTSISGSMTETNFKNSSSNGIWGYLPSKLNGSANTNYKGAPNNSAGDTIDKTSAPATTVTDANSYTIGLGVKADYSTKAGTYTNTYVLTATGNDTPFTVTYGKTTTDAVSFNGGTLPSTFDYATSTTSITLSSAVPTRTGYTFLRWCDGTVSDNDTSCSGTTYNAGATYNIDRTSATNSVTLYAVWSPTITIRANTGISNVKLNNGTACTNASSGCTVTGLEYGKSYSLAATLATGYNFSSWSRSSTTNTGSITSTSSASTTYTVGSVPVTITPSATLKTYSLAITFAGEGVSSVKVCKTSGDCSGSNLMGTVSASGNSVSGLAYNAAYYLYPTFSSNYELGSWAKTSSYGTLSSTSTANPTFTMGLGNGAVTITGKSNMKAMQDFTATECTAMSTGATVQLYDSRDDNAYSATKLGGNCWMTQNLRYVGDAGSTSGSMVMKSATSNISSDTTISYSDLTNGKTYNYAYLHIATDDQVPSDATYTATDMGVWYNYAAASARTITGNSNSASATYDICPKNWRLPTNVEIMNVTQFATMFNVIAGGYYGYYNSTLNHTNVGNAFWWSSTNANATAMHTLQYVASAGVLSSYYHTRDNGMSIRCILNDTRTIADVSYMQDVNSQMVINTSDDTTKTMINRRDNQRYTVAKLGGNLWMTRNLAIGCNGSGTSYSSSMSSKNLTISDSNIIDAWSTPTTRLSDTSSGTDDFTTPKMQCSGSYGAWYNYAAASAGTIIDSSSNTTTATYDICPSGWSMPTYMTAAAIPNYASSFSGVTGGYYEYNGSLANTHYGAWWTKVQGNNSGYARESILYNGDTGALQLAGSFLTGRRSHGRYVRCVAKTALY